MANVVLVHGGFHGGWCWRDVRKLLAAEGHDVFTPSLTGLGDRRHLLDRSINFDTHVADILNLFDAEELDDVILAGHSYGGAVISAVADRIPDRIRALLYIDALVVEDGESVFDVLPAASVERIMEAVRTEGEGWKVPPVPASNYGFTGERLAWVDRRCCPHPLATMIQPISITGEASAVANKVYIYATGWGELTSTTASCARAEAMGWRTHRWPCSHEVMIERPSELAELIGSL